MSLGKSKVGYLEKLHLIVSDDGHIWVIADKKEAISLARTYRESKTKIFEARLDQIIGSAKLIET